MFEWTMGLLEVVCGLGLIAFGAYNLIVLEFSGWMGLIYIVLPAVGGALLSGTGIALLRDNLFGGIENGK